MKDLPYMEQLIAIAGRSEGAGEKSIRSRVRSMRIARKVLERITGENHGYSVMGWHRSLLSSERVAFQVSADAGPTVSEVYTDRGAVDMSQRETWVSEMENSSDRAEVVSLAQRLDAEGAKILE